MDHRPLVSLLAVAVVAACSARDQRDVEVGGESPLSTLKRLVQLDVSGVSLAVTRRGFERSRAVDTVAPARAHQAARIERRDRPGAWLAVADASLRDVGGVADGAAVTYRDALPNIDVVDVLLPDRFEELRVLRSPGNAYTASYELAVGPAIDHVRLREGRVELVTTTGLVPLSSEPIFAIDAVGNSRTAELTLDHQRRTLQPDREYVARRSADDERTLVRGRRPRRGEQGHRGGRGHRPVVGGALRSGDQQVDRRGTSRGAATLAAGHGAERRKAPRRRRTIRYRRRGGRRDRAVPAREQRRDL